MPRRIVAVGLGIALAGLFLSICTTRPGQVAEQLDIDPTLPPQARSAHGRPGGVASTQSPPGVGTAAPGGAPVALDTPVPSETSSPSGIPAVSSAEAAHGVMALTVDRTEVAVAPASMGTAAPADLLASGVSAADASAPLAPEAELIPAVAAPAATLPPPPPPPLPPPPPPPVAAPAPVVTAAGPGDAALYDLRMCESGGDYAAVSPGGSYRGAYQFNPGTWNGVASRWYPALVGIDPAAASPADQDAMARALYDESGASPWPHCGRYL